MNAKGAPAKRVVFGEFLGQELVDERDEQGEVVAAPQGCQCANSRAGVVRSCKRVQGALAPGYEPVGSAARSGFNSLVWGGVHRVRKSAGHAPAASVSPPRYRNGRTGGRPVIAAGDRGGGSLFQVYFLHHGAELWRPGAEDGVHGGSQKPASNRRRRPFQGCAPPGAPGSYSVAVHICTGGRSEPWLFRFGHAGTAKSGVGCRLYPTKKDSVRSDAAGVRQSYCSPGFGFARCEDRRSASRRAWSPASCARATPEASAHSPRSRDGW